jgi:6-phosphogluconolactonase
MQNSRTLGRSNSFMNLGFHRSAMALTIAVAIGVSIMTDSKETGRGTMKLATKIPSSFTWLLSLLVLLCGGGGGPGTSYLPSNPPSGPTAPNNSDPQSIAVDPAGKFAYVLDGGSNGNGGYVSMYTINPTTGALASIGPPVSTDGYGLYAGSVTVDPSGKFAYVTNEGNPWVDGDADNGNVAMYTIDATTGALASTVTINGNCPGLCNPSSMVVDPSGKFAYVVTGGAGTPFSVAIYTIDATTGALTSIGTIAAGQVPNSVAVDPAGHFVYVATANGPGAASSVSMYAINATTRVLASIGTIAAGTDSVSVAVDPSGKFAYVANLSSNDVSMYTIDATTGALVSIESVSSPM